MTTTSQTTDAVQASHDNLSGDIQANEDWPGMLEAKRLACESRLLPVMEQINPKAMLIMQQMTRHPESAGLLTMITSDPDLSLAQAVQVLLDAISLQEQMIDVDS